MLLKRHTVRLLCKVQYWSLPLFCQLDSGSKVTEPPLKTNRASTVSYWMEVINSNVSGVNQFCVPEHCI